MKEWKIPVTWEECGVVRVTAYTLAEALQHVREDSDNIPLPDKGDYVDGSFTPSMDEVEEIRDLYNDSQSDDADGLIIEKISNVYTYLYKDQLVSAEDDYLEYFQEQFREPSLINWRSKQLGAAKRTLISLLSELQESRKDFAELMDVVGLDKNDLKELGF